MPRWVQVTRFVVCRKGLIEDTPALFGRRCEVRLLESSVETGGPSWLAVRGWAKAWAANDFRLGFLESDTPTPSGQHQPRLADKRRQSRIQVDGKDIIGL
ncbi:MAG: hypothetical protein ACI8TX_002685 [Hyphomicrobiaceae bacterium]|jgi:hypothetical protein